MAGTAKVISFTLNDGTNNYDFKNMVHGDITLRAGRELIEINRTAVDLKEVVEGRKDWQIECQVEMDPTVVKPVRLASFNSAQEYTVTFQSDTGQTTWTVTNAAVSFGGERISPDQPILVDLTIRPGKDATVTAA